MSLITKVIVFGGNGYVGRQVCQGVFQLGIDKVTAVSRSGSPKEAFTNKGRINWVKGDALNSGLWTSELNESTAVVSCIGAFGSNDV